MDLVSEICHAVCVALSGICGGVGVLALTSPRAFAAVSKYGNRTVLADARVWSQSRRFDIDTFIVGHARLFGVAALGTLAYLWLISTYGPQSYSNSFLLIILAFALGIGIVSLFQIKRQAIEIESHRAEAHTDVLTGAANRRGFDTEFSRRIAQRQRQGKPLCLLIVDIDEFKSINDAYGHALGDLVIKGIAQTLMASCRDTDTVARIGGDEFVLILPGTTLETACVTAERLRSQICGTPFRANDCEHSITVSMGLAEALADDDATSLLKRADSALYAAKDAGRNCCYRDGGPEPAIPTLLDQPALSR